MVWIFPVNRKMFSFIYRELPCLFSLSHFNHIWDVCALISKWLFLYLYLSFYFVFFVDNCVIIIRSALWFFAFQVAARSCYTYFFSLLVFYSWKNDLLHLRLSQCVIDTHTVCLSFLFHFPLFSIFHLSLMVNDSNSLFIWNCAQNWSSRNR